MSKKKQKNTVSSNLISPSELILPTEKLPLRERIYQQRYIWWAFFIPFSLMFLVYVAMQVWPFGQNSVLVLDLNGQYVYFYAALRNFVRGDASLMYSWSRVLGGEFFGIYAYYIASPFSYIVALFPATMITEALLLIILIKFGISGATMAFYLNKTYPTKKINAVIFSTMYALCAYALTYGHNIMWLDAFMWFPLVIYGAEQLIKNKRFTLYVTFLAITLISHFYIGYMVCIFLVPYFFFYYFTRTKEEINPNGEKNHFIKTLTKFGLFSLLAVGIATIILLPTYYSLMFGKNTFTDPDYSFKWQFNVLEFLYKFFFGAADTTRREGMPFVYCGMLTLMIIPFFFINRKISLRHKIGYGALFLFLFTCFIIKPIDMMMHMGQVPNWLNFRYSFMFSFLMIVCAYRAFSYLKDIKFSDLCACGIVFGIILFLTLAQDKNKDFGYVDEGYDYNILCVGLSALIVIALLILLYLYKKDMAKKLGILAIGAFVLVEALGAGVLANVALNMDVSYSDRETYTKFIRRTQSVVDMVQDYDDSFYRMEKTFHRKINDPMALNMRGISLSTSTMNKKTQEFVRRMGYSSKSYWSKYQGGTPVSDALLGIKYILNDNNPKDNNTLVDAELLEYLYGSPIFYESDKSAAIDARNIEGQIVAYKNDYALSIAYAVNRKILDVDFYEGYFSAIQLMNQLVSGMLGEEIEIFKPVTIIENEESLVVDEEGNRIQKLSFVEFKNCYMPNYVDKTLIGFSSNKKSFESVTKMKHNGKEATVTFRFSVPVDSPVFLYIPTKNHTEPDIAVNGVKKGTAIANETSRVLYLGMMNKGSENDLTFTLKEDSYLIYKKEIPLMYYFDIDAYKYAMTELQKNQLIISKDYTERKLSGTITVDEGNSILFTTIPYDKGWKIKIDGKRVEPILLEHTELQDIKDKDGKVTGQKEVKTMDPLLNGVIAVEITPGTHTVEFEYMPIEFVIGVTVTAVSLTVFAAIILIEFKRGAYKNKSKVLCPVTEEEEEEVPKKKHKKRK